MENKIFLSIYEYMSGNKKRNKFKEEPVRMNVLLDKSLRKRYKQHCLDKDIIMSERIRELIEQDLKNNE